MQATARILRGNTRETDLIARYGGEEFVVVLPATDAETAHSICERIVMAFRNTGHVVGSDHAKVDGFNRLRDARRATAIQQLSPTSSRRPTRRFTPRKCAAAIAPCPLTGNFQRRSPAQRLSVH